MLLAIPVWTIVMLVILAILIIAIVVLYFLGKRMQKKQAESEAQIEQYKQTVNMLIIDKKKMRMNESGLPQSVIDQAPKLMRRAKLPVVKAKVGPQLMTLIADDKIFDDIPVKKEVKATVSGIYITSVKGLHGKSAPAPAVKKSKFKQFVERMQEKAGAGQVK